MQTDSDTAFALRRYLAGESGDALVNALETARSAERVGRYADAARAYLIAHLVTRDTIEDLPSAAFYVRTATGFAEKAGHLELYAAALAAWYQLDVERGELGELESLERGLLLIDREQQAYLRGDLSIAAARALRVSWSGDFDAAVRYLLWCPRNGLTPVEVRCQAAMLAMFYAATQRFDLTQAALAHSQPESRPVGSEAVPEHRIGVQTVVFQSVAFALMDRQLAALRALYAERTGCDNMAQRNLIELTRRVIEDIAGGVAGEYRSIKHDSPGGFERTFTAVTHAAQRTRRPRRGLTTSELRVLSVAVEGRPVKEMAQELGLQPKTVTNHLTAIIAKLRANNRAEAVALARKYSLV